MISYNFKHSSICRDNGITKAELIFQDNKHILENAELKARNTVLEIKLKAVIERCNDAENRYNNLWQKVEKSPRVYSKSRQKHFRVIPD